MECTNLERGLLDAENGKRDESSSDANVTELLSVDDMLVNHVGEFGRGQFWHFVLVSLAWIVEALHTMVLIFGDRVPEWRCVDRPGIWNASSAAQICTPTSQLCDLEPGSWEWVGGKSASTVSEWNLICGSAYKVGLCGSLFFIGALCGAGMYGNLSDSFLGRKGSLALSCMMTVTMGLLTSLAPNYWSYAAARFVTGLNACGIGLSSFVLSTEIVGPSRRGPVGMSAFYFFSCGIILLSQLDYVSSSWRELYVITALPGVAYCLFVLPFIRESPRWYLVKGKVGDAMRVMRALARRNGNVVPEGVCLSVNHIEEEEAQRVHEEVIRPHLLAPQEHCHHERDTESATSFRADSSSVGLVTGTWAEEKSSKHEGTLMDVFRFRETRIRMILMVLIWFFIGVCYYGISLNVTNLGFDLHLSVFLNGLIEMPAFSITALLLGRLGRKVMLVAAMCSAGFCCLLGSLMFVNVNGVPTMVHLLQPHSPSYQEMPSANEDTSAGNFMSVVRLLCGVVGIFGSAGAYNLVYIYTTELFPTVVRNAALGLATQAGSVGSVVAPVIAVLGRYNPSLPFVIFGVVSLAGAALSTRLPETGNQILHETMEGLERTTTSQKSINHE